MDSLTRHLIGCTACHLHKYRKKQVVGTGEIPAQILIVGEGPGRSENMLGVPFCGRSGSLLRDAMADASRLSGLPIPDAYITNMVHCRPCAGKRDPNRPPTVAEIEACRYNLQEVDHEVNPARVILLGKIAARFGKALWPTAYCLPHPAYILRRGGAASTDYKSFVRAFSDIYKDLSGSVCYQNTDSIL